MSDAISRASAIDAVKKNTFRLTFAEEQNCEGRVAWSADAVYSDVIEGALLELPSAQPEIIRCRDCKYFAGEGMYCGQDICVQFDHFYCYYGERKE